MRKTRFGHDEGNILVMSVTFVTVLLITGLAFMKWAVNSHWDSAYEKATVQAYFIAQIGCMERGLEFLKAREVWDLPRGTVFLKPGVVEGYGEHINNIVRQAELGEGVDRAESPNTFDVYSTGRVYFNDPNRPRGQNRVKVERTATLRTRLRSFASYQHLTHLEVTKFGEIIWFWHKDTLFGRVHSNDYLGIKYSPRFFGRVTTSKHKFKELQANAKFKYPPEFNVPKIVFPKTARAVRNNAEIISTDNSQTMVRLVLKGDQGCEVWKWQRGVDPDEFAKLDRTIRDISWKAIFVDGECEVEGQLSGNLTIGSTGDMLLIDNIQYIGSDANNGRLPAGMMHRLGLVSEKNVLIKNNLKNGRLNGFKSFPNDVNRHSININASIVALNESFTFEQQNDEWDLYQGPGPDERGVIYLTGSVAQWRRGYVHRRNHNGTGYEKAYVYDSRLDEQPPPYFLELTDENGHGKFDIISTGEIRAGAEND